MPSPAEHIVTPSATPDELALAMPPQPRAVDAARAVAAPSPTGLAPAGVAVNPPPLPTQATWASERAMQAKTAEGQVNSRAVTGEDFLRANRLHIKNGSLFDGSGLMIHPRELDPKNEAALQKKLTTVMTMDAPSFFEKQGPARSIAVQLGYLLPVSLQAQRDVMMKNIEKLNTKIQAGVDTDVVREAQDRADPLAALQRMVQEESPLNPAQLDFMKHSLAVYLMVEERLAHPLPAANGVASVPYAGGAGALCDHPTSADRILVDLETSLGISPQAFREAALGGIDGVGAALKLDPAFVAQVKALTEDLATHRFSDFRLKAWQKGRVALPQGTIAEQCDAGVPQLVRETIESYRAARKGNFDVPADIANEEALFAKRFALLDPEQRRAAWLLGYEYGYTPDNLADKISGHGGVYGLNSHNTNHPNELFPAVRRIYVSGKGMDSMGSDETFCHENTHIMFPQYFTPEQQALVRSGLADTEARFDVLYEWMHHQDHTRELEKLFEDYKREMEKEQAHDPKHYAITDSKGRVVQMETIFPHVEDLNQLRYLVDFGHQSLRVNGERYAKSGYDSPAARLHEVFARYGAVRQTKYRSGHSRMLLNAVAPEMNHIWEKAYLPHLTTVCDAIELGIAPIKTVVDEANGIVPAPVASEVRPPIRQPEPGVSQAAERALAAAGDVRESDWLRDIPSFSSVLSNPSSGFCAHGQGCACADRPDRSVAGATINHEGPSVSPYGELASHL